MQKQERHRLFHGCPPWGGSMSLRMILWKHLKKRKTFSFTILLLMWAVSFTMITAMTTYRNVNDHINDMLEYNHAPDYVNYLWGSEDQLNENWLSSLAEHELVDHIEKEQLIAYDSSKVLIKDQALDNSLYLKVYQPDRYPYQFTQTDETTRPTKGSIFLPYIFQEQYACDIGDEVIFQLPEGSKTYTIQDFFEDPIYGNAMFGLKYILFAQADFEELSGILQSKMTLINTYVTPTDDMNQTLYQLNQDVGIEHQGEFAYPLSFFVDGTTLIPSLMLIIVICFSGLMFLITLLVLSYALKAAISEDTLEIGILKSIGFHANQIIQLNYLLYLSISLLGILLGAIASHFVLTPLETMVISSSGLFTTGTPHIELICFVGILLLACIFLMITFNTRRIRKLSCVQALSSKSNDIYFSSPVHVTLMQLHKLPLTMKLSIKHIVTHGKQYLMLFMIAFFLSECLLTILTVNRYFQVEGMASITGGMDADIYISYSNKKDYAKIPELIEKINEEEEILLAYNSGGIHASVDGSQLYIVFTDEFLDDFATTPLKGRFPFYDNEIVITEMVLDQMQKDVGDNVTVMMNDGTTKEYLIVGAHQTFNEMGKQALMSRDGIARLGASTLGYRYNIQFVKRGQQEALVEQFNKKLTKEDTSLRLVDEHANVAQYTDAEQVAILALTLLIVLLSVLLVGMISFLLAKISMEKEKTDLSILYFQGFTQRQLRLQFSLRFTIISLLGVGIAILFNVWSNAYFMSLILHDVGVTRFISHYTLFMLMSPIVLIGTLTFLFSYLATRKVKQIKVQEIAMDA